MRAMTRTWRYRTILSELYAAFDTLPRPESYGLTTFASIKMTIMKRSQQVQLMDHIYRRASVVLIWLGEDIDEEKADKACQCIQLLMDAHPRLKDIRADVINGVGKNDTEWNSFLGISRQSSDDVHRSLGIPLLHSPEFDALEEVLLRNSWFSRAWTWQESFVAKERKFLPRIMVMVR